MMFSLVYVLFIPLSAASLMLIYSKLGLGLNMCKNRWTGFKQVLRATFDHVIITSGSRATRNNNWLSKLQVFLKDEKASSNIKKLNKRKEQHKHYNSAHLKQKLLFFFFCKFGKPLVPVNPNEKFTQKIRC